ncbi:Probable transmembrane protein [hydrothermal vent metagenome]|uniref:Probable transmembrane protein n=1 Tax=hydrothermal vent metagenome TaxID=652676 RepID=A0A1W1C3A9_9ZZZZ
MTIQQFIELFIMPPGLIILILFFAFIYRKQFISKFLVLTALATLYGLSTSFIAEKLTNQVDTYPILNIEQAKLAQVIVVLTAGSRYAPEFKAFVSGKNGLVRARYAALLHNLTKLPLLVTGGNANKKLNKPSEAKTLEVSLYNLGVKTKFLEENSKNTFESASNTFAILKENNINKIILVTNASHMKRSVKEFERYGLEVLAAPTLKPIFKKDWTKFMPYSKYLSKSKVALHEIIGQYWYQIKHKFQ